MEENKKIWEVRYVVDTGYDWIYRVCIIKAENEEAAIAILDAEIGSKLKCESYIMANRTKITECEGVILYDGRS